MFWAVCHLFTAGGTLVGGDGGGVVGDVVGGGVGVGAPICGGMEGGDPEAGPPIPIEGLGATDHRPKASVGGRGDEAGT